MFVFNFILSVKDYSKRGSNNITFKGCFRVYLLILNLILQTSSTTSQTPASASNNCKEILDKRLQVRWELQVNIKINFSIIISSVNACDKKLFAIFLMHAKASVYKLYILF